MADLGDFGWGLRDSVPVIYVTTFPIYESVPRKRLSTRNQRDT